MVSFVAGLRGTGREQASRTPRVFPRQPYSTAVDGTRGHVTGPLITRRSQVQILPPHQRTCRSEPVREHRLSALSGVRRRVVPDMVLYTRPRLRRNRVARAVPSPRISARLPRSVTFACCHLRGAPVLLHSVRSSRARDARPGYQRDGEEIRRSPGQTSSPLLSVRSDTIACIRSPTRPTLRANTECPAASAPPLAYSGVRVTVRECRVRLTPTDFSVRPRSLSGLGSSSLEGRSHVATSISRLSRARC